jgi:DNA-binding MarR family transcriptional regulator
VIARKAAPSKASETQAVLDGVSIIARRLRQIDGVHGITPERLSVLTIIAKSEPISIGGLADESNVRAATMSRMISAMDEDGLIQRQDDKNDGRGVLISLTRKGRRVFAQANKKSLQELEVSLSQLSKDEVKTLLDLGKALSAFYRR